MVCMYSYGSEWDIKKECKFQAYEWEDSDEVLWAMKKNAT
jgi:hypothetical protein